MRTTNETAPAGDLGRAAGLNDPRVDLAAERTMLAWVRTGLALMGFGFVVARFALFLRELAASGDRHAAGGHGGSLALGVALVAMGVWVLVASAVRYRRYIAALNAGQVVRPPGPMFALAVAGTLAFLGIMMAVYLLVIA